MVIEIPDDLFQLVNIGSSSTVSEETTSQFGSDGKHCGLSSVPGGNGPIAKAVFENKTTTNIRKKGNIFLHTDFIQLN